MRQKLRIKADRKTKGRFILHPHQIHLLGKHQTDYILLRHGGSSRPVRISFSRKLGVNEVALSQNVMDQLSISPASRYELVHADDELRLGPYIGFLVTITKKDLAKNLPRITRYLHCYQEIGGKIVAFSLEGIDTKRRFIFGYVYNPVTKRWVRGRFTYPSAIFIKSRMIPYRYRKHFQSVLGNTIFNNFNFNKYMMYNLLQSFGLGSYLPPSTLYRNQKDLKGFLDQYGSVYCKPIYGSRGKSIVKITKRKKEYLVQYRENSLNRKRVFHRFHPLSAFMRNQTKKGEYLLQKAVTLARAKRRIIDFRVLMVKNHLGKWEDAGLYARYSTPGSIVSNISAGGRAEKGEITLKKVLKLSDYEAVRLRQKLSLLSHQVAACLDAAGVHCGHMGVDIGIDSNHHLWIIEIQHNNPDPTLVLDANDDSNFWRLLRTNMMYLKQLAGFIPKTFE